MKATVKTDDGQIVTGEVVEEFTPHKWTVIKGDPESVFEFKTPYCYRRRDAEGDREWSDYPSAQFCTYPGEHEITEAEAQRIIAAIRDPYQHFGDLDQP
jgi:hypothetical protein